MNSKFLQLAKNDLLKGLVVSIITAVLIYLQKILTDTGIDAIDWRTILNIALIAGVGYLVKNLVTNSNGELGKAEHIVETSQE